MSLTITQQNKYFRSLLFDINLARTCMDGMRVQEKLELIDAWCYAHNCSNGQLDEEECQEHIDNIMKQFDPIV